LHTVEGDLPVFGRVNPPTGARVLLPSVVDLRTNCGALPIDARGAAAKQAIARDPNTLTSHETVLPKVTKPCTAEVNTNDVFVKVLE